MLTTRQTNLTEIFKNLHKQRSLSNYIIKMIGKLVIYIEIVI